MDKLSLDLTHFNRIFVFGDPHGQYDLLRYAYDILEYEESDAIISCGDNHDRSSRSFETALHFCHGRGRYSVRGNHEEMLIDAFLEKQSYAATNLRFNGGEWALRYDVAELEFLAQLVKAKMPYILDLTFHGKKIAIAHADLPAKVPLELSEDDIELITWNHRSHRDKEKVIAGYDLCIHGHKILQTPQMHQNRLYIDTGGYIDNYHADECKHGLTCLEVRPDGVQLHRFSKVFNGNLEYIPNTDFALLEKIQAALKV
ncbi:metallophosphoesterase [Vibrio mediterranei]|uniref:metallophosphoesterase n=1 Tax=Vibrio mediterranei TaxID=689 RepID=UPI0040679B0C